MGRRKIEMEYLTDRVRKVRPRFAQNGRYPQLQTVGQGKAGRLGTAQRRGPAGEF
jgi:hypothetical protein